MKKLLTCLTLTLAFGCDSGTSMPGPGAPPPGVDAGPGAPGADAGPMASAPLTDEAALGALDEAALVELCEESAPVLPTRAQSCTLEGLELPDAAMCATARDACLARMDPEPMLTACADIASDLVAEMSGCQATVAEYRACRSALDELDRMYFAQADCSIAGMPDALDGGEEPTACTGLWDMCPDVFGFDDEEP